LRELAAAGDEEIVAEVFRDFESDTAARLTRLRSALHCGHIREAGAQAHAIKGSAVQIGAYGVAELCRRIEGMAREEADISSAACELELEFAVLRSAIARGAGG
jgi:HPt (histidine-containing phosphotransfer) domain-containing protein